MGVALVGALLALVILLQPREPSELVVVLPEKSGRVGTVIVERDGREVVLNKAYAASRIVGKGAPRAEQLAPPDVGSTFGDALRALPSRPTSFLLYFDRGTDELTAASRVELERMLDELRRRPTPDIVVIGHTDRVGAEEANDELSLQRAERVRVDLINQGIPADRIRSAGRGEREPVIPTEDSIDEPLNRRVEINVR
jgi:outer membrane protein OmpA-like peptidoglycan-associated protein